MNFLDIDPKRRISAGDNVTLHPSRLHFFDRETEAAIL
jgi:hypothetical protein